MTREVAWLRLSLFLKIDIFSTRRHLVAGFFMWGFMSRHLYHPVSRIPLHSMKSIFCVTDFPGREHASQVISIWVIWWRYYVSNSRFPPFFAGSPAVQKGGSPLKLYTAANRFVQTSKTQNAPSWFFPVRKEMPKMP
jgi:hypothetical protein